MALFSLYFLMLLLQLMWGPPLVHERPEPQAVTRIQQQERSLQVHQLHQEFEWCDLEEQQEERMEAAWSQMKTQEVERGCSLWNLGLFGVFLLVELWWQHLQREAMFNVSQSEEEDYDLDSALPPTLVWPGRIPDCATLEDFYERQIHRREQDLAHGCEFVEGFTDKLMEVCRTLGRKKTGLVLENGVGVGSTFERWGGRKEPIFDVLVPFQPPQGHTFRMGPTCWQSALDRHGWCQVALEAAECTCASAGVLCPLHPRGKVDHSRQAMPLEALLCTSGHLDAQKVHTWFQALVDKAWGLISYKYDFRLTLVPATLCKLRLDYKSGRVLHINMMPALRRDDSCVFLVGKASEVSDLSGVYWLESFAVYERQFLTLMKRFLPENSCHLKCLSILNHLKETKLRDDKAMLTSYHFKTALMHLLTVRSLDAWRPERISERMQDLLCYLGRSLSEKCLNHFAIGNASLPQEIAIPREHQSMEHLNLLHPLVMQRSAYSQAEQEYQDVMFTLTGLTSQSLDITVPLTSQSLDITSPLTSKYTQRPNALTSRCP